MSSKAMTHSKKKKRKSQMGPRRKRMDRDHRLMSARATNWVMNFSGKKIVHAYRRWFGVDLLTAIAELRLLGVPVDQEYEAQVRKTIEQAALQKQRIEDAKKEISEEDLVNATWGTEFTYIAGYTSGGAPYGLLKWEVDATNTIVNGGD